MTAGGKINGNNVCLAQGTLSASLSLLAAAWQNLAASAIWRMSAAASLLACKMKVASILCSSNDGPLTAVAFTAPARAAVRQRGGRRRRERMGIGIISHLKAGIAQRNKHIAGARGGGRKMAAEKLVKAALTGKMANRVGEGNFAHKKSARG
jgi:hypothetical protein